MSSSYRYVNNRAGPSNPHRSNELYIPTLHENRGRNVVESRLDGYHLSKQDDYRSQSYSTMDTYDRIGHDQGDFYAPRVASRRNEAEDQFGDDESLIPGVGRGLRSKDAPQRSYRDQPVSVDRFISIRSANKSPYLAEMAKYTNFQSHHSPIAVTASSRPRLAQPESESDSMEDVSLCCDDDYYNGADGLYSTGNHRAFAATSAGGTITHTSSRRQAIRPTVGQETLNQIDFDRYTDTDIERKARPKAFKAGPKMLSDPNSYPAEYNQGLRLGSMQSSNRATRADPLVRASASFDPNGPFHSLRVAKTFGNPDTQTQRDIDFNNNASHALAYQQHLATRTLSSPAIRSLVGDRSKSPDSPSPSPSISGTGRERSKSGSTVVNGFPSKAAPVGLVRPTAIDTRLSRQASHTAISDFEQLARRLQYDVQLTRRAEQNEQEATDTDRSNSGSGFGPGSQPSSANTKVDPAFASVAQTPRPIDNGLFAYPAYLTPGHIDSDFVSPMPDPVAPVQATHTVPGHPSKVPSSLCHVHFPDATEMTRAVPSPPKQPGEDEGVAQLEPSPDLPFARIEELDKVKEYIDSLQKVLNDSSDQILYLEQGQKTQQVEFENLRQQVKQVRKDAQGIDAQIVAENAKHCATASSKHTQHKSTRQAPAETNSQACQDANAVNDVHPTLPSQNANAPNEIHPTLPNADANSAAPASLEAADGRPDRQGEQPTAEPTFADTLKRIYKEVDALRIALHEQWRIATAIVAVDTQKNSNQPSHGQSKVKKDNDQPYLRRSTIQTIHDRINRLSVEIEVLTAVVARDVLPVVSNHEIVWKKSRKPQAYLTAESYRQCTSKKAKQPGSRASETDTEHVDNRPRVKRSLRRSNHVQPASDPIVALGNGVRTSGCLHAADGDSETEELELVISAPVFVTKKGGELQRNRVSFERPDRRYKPATVVTDDDEQEEDQEDDEEEEEEEDEEEEEEDADATLNAEVVNQGRKGSRRRYRLQDQDDDDAMFASAVKARADKVVHRASAHRSSVRKESKKEAEERVRREPEHDARHCTVCSRRRKSDKRKQARKEKVLQAEQHRQESEREEQILLESIDAHGSNSWLDQDIGDPSRLPLIYLPAPQLKTLERLLEEHWDEFDHQKMIYSQMADELKHMTPHMSRLERQILAQHVLEAVEALEAKADRIERLEKILASSVPLVAETQKLPAKPKSKSTKTSKSPASANSLRTALDSHERLAASNNKTGRLTPKAQQAAKERAKRQVYADPYSSIWYGRNSPPTMNVDP